jgi:hypothetical protein
MTAEIVLGEVLDHFAKSGETPENWWAFSDDQTELCLDHTSKDGSKFWLDLCQDGTIIILWKEAGAETPKILKFTAKDPTP